MAGFSIKPRPKGAPKVAAPRMINPLGKGSTQLKPPRLKQPSIGKRDYTKPELTAEGMPPVGGSFGDTGLTGGS